MGLALNAAFTRSRRWRFIEQRILTPASVKLTRLVRGTTMPLSAATPHTAEALGREWERLLGDSRYARIIRVDLQTQTAYGEITGRCPLRGTGDLAACYRLMAYDRGLMSPLAARFVVLESQAEIDKRSCKIAIRPQLLDASDLLPAHRRHAAALSEQRAS